MVKEFVIPWVVPHYRRFTALMTRCPKTIYALTVKDMKITVIFPVISALIGEKIADPRQSEKEVKPTFKSVKLIKSCTNIVIIGESITLQCYKHTKKRVMQGKD